MRAGNDLKRGEKRELMMVNDPRTLEIINQDGRHGPRQAVGAIQY